tara:strand:+ start:1753 stop:2412 length:660 start_codon:yes stop_codon:yes gene_type:complete
MSRKANELQIDIANNPARLGKVTGSRVNDIMPSLKTGAYSRSRRTYMLQLIAQRLTGRARQSFQTSAMKRGSDLEPEAKQAYEIATGNLVTDTEFVEHPIIDMFGASPDGLVEDKNILIEIKCMGDERHLDFLLTGEIPLQYQHQMIAQCACTGVPECDFVAYHDEFPKGKEIGIKRFVPTAAEILIVEEEVIFFLEEAEKLEKTNLFRIYKQHKERQQ